jgi:hypothetical protein
MTLFIPDAFRRCPESFLLSLLLFILFPGEWNKGIRERQREASQTTKEACGKEGFVNGLFVSRPFKGDSVVE